jgi:hypothetical protein
MWRVLRNTKQMCADRVCAKEYTTSLRSKV